MWGWEGFEQQRLCPDSFHSLSTVLCGDGPLQGQVTKAGGLGLDQCLAKATSQGPSPCPPIRLMKPLCFSPEAGLLCLGLGIADLLLSPITQLTPCCLGKGGEGR